jgi:hypothetical protein
VKRDGLILSCHVLADLGDVIGDGRKSRFDDSSQGVYLRVECLLGHDENLAWRFPILAIDWSWLGRLRPGALPITPAVDTPYLRVVNAARSHRLIQQIG